MMVARRMPGAGVRKAPREETAGGLVGRASDAMGIWRWWSFAGERRAIVWGVIAVATNLAGR